MPDPLFYKPGPGVLRLGDSTVDVSAQVTGMAVEPSESVSASPSVPVLSGDELPGDESASLTYRLKGSLLQLLGEFESAVDFSWEFAGTEQNFLLIPSTEIGRGVSGKVRVVPLKVGGDVKVRATVDLDWAIIGTPTYGPITP